jgi:DNA-binding IclR family transcriptional regulator
LAQKPWAELGSAEFIAFSGLAASTSHDASRKLVEMDLIEQDEHGIYHVVDPFFAMWLRRHSAGG